MGYGYELKKRLWDDWIRFGSEERRCLIKLITRQTFCKLKIVCQATTGWYCGNEQMQLWVKFGHWVGMTVTQWRKAQQMWSVHFFYISKTNLENHIKIHHGENPTSVASAILQHLKQQILKIMWRYKVEENPTSVASAILQHLKQQILTIIWRCIVEENPTSVASVNLQSLKQPGWELI